jgi:hypothetical protein
MDIILDITIFDIHGILQVISHKISNFFEYPPNIGVNENG